MVHENWLIKMNTDKKGKLSKLAKVAIGEKGLLSIYICSGNFVCFR